jgi:hypothetical protein
MTRRVTAVMLAFTLVAALAVAFAAFAQEQPAPEQPAPQQPPQAQPAPAPPTPEQPVPEQSALLRLKFAPNETMRYRIHADAEGTMRMNMPMSGQGGQSSMMPGELPVHMVIQGEGVAKVLRVDASGAARLRVSADNLKMIIDIMGQNMAFSVTGGKYSVTQNGKRVEGGKIPMIPGGGKIPVLQEPIELKIGPRGELLDLAIPGFTEMMKMMPGMSLKDMMKGQVLLPEQPLLLGQPWSESKNETLPGTNAPITYEMKMALNGIETWAGGRKIANIRVESVTTGHNIDMGQAMQQGAKGMPQGMPPMSGTMSIDQQLGGTMQFDTTRGMLIRFDFQLNQQMSMNGAVPTPQQGSQNMDMDMQFTIKGALAKI